MTLAYIPVQVFADDPAERQAFLDVLTSENAGNVTAVAAGDTPAVALICPSGHVADAKDLPAVLLGTGQDSDDPRIVSIQTPSTLFDVLSALESLANAQTSFNQACAYAGWHLDPARLSLTKPDERSLTLTETEARLLACLFDAKGGVVTRDTLLQRVWGYRPGLETHTLETHIYRLRKKIEDDSTNPARIMTDSDGYYFRG